MSVGSFISDSLVTNQELLNYENASYDTTRHNSLPQSKHLAINREISFKARELKASSKQMGKHIHKNGLAV